MRRDILAGAIWLFLAWSLGADATETATFSVQTPDGPVVVDSVLTRGSEPHPAVIVLSGSKGFASPAYAELSETLNRLGLDVFKLRVLSGADLDTIARAGTARARIAYYATRLPRWTAAVRALVDRLDADPRHAGRIGILGISLGAQIAAAATADLDDVRALVVVDGGFPDGFDPSRRTLPPLKLIWGSADRTFPIAIAHKLLATQQNMRRQATLKIYEGGGHDFFVQPTSPQGATAQRDAAEFLATTLK